MTSIQNTKVSLLTRGAGFFESGKEYLRKLGFGANRGPLAVENNLLKGLNLIGADYNLNPSVGEFADNICILRSTAAAEVLGSLKNLRKIAAGPNLTAQALADFYKNNLPIDLFLAPSDPVKLTYIHYGIPKQKVLVWPVGIDTEKFEDTNIFAKTTDCLLYFKRRSREEYSQVRELLAKREQSCRTISYGSYTQSDLIKAAKQCRYAIILDGTESQGIAIQSIMSANLPLFVFDQIYLGSAKPNESALNEELSVSSVPYWDDSCGLKIPTDTFKRSKNPYMEIPQTGAKFDEFLANLTNYRPRQFILENLSLTKQAGEFMAIFK